VALPILNILVPQVGHVPSVAGFPFFMVIALAPFISRFVRHFKQYASNVAPPPPFPAGWASNMI
jgi:hypothetical protein